MYLLLDEKGVDVLAIYIRGIKAFNLI